MSEGSRFDSIAPTNWNGFLCLNQNKTELFAYLSKELVTCTDDDILLTCAYATTCVTSSGQMASSFNSPCNHEEADTKVFARSLQGHTKITIRTVGHRRLSYSYIHICSFPWSTRRTVDRFRYWQTSTVFPDPFDSDRSRSIKSFRNSVFPCLHRM